MQERRKNSCSTPGLEIPPVEGNGNSFRCSGLGNPMAEEPVGLQSMGSQRVGQDWANTHPWTLGHLVKFHLIYSWVFLSPCLVSDRNQTLLISLRVNPYLEYGRGGWALRWAPSEGQGGQWVRASPPNSASPPRFTAAVLCFADSLGVWWPL